MEKIQYYLIFFGSALTLLAFLAWYLWGLLSMLLTKVFRKLKIKETKYIEYMALSLLIVGLTLVSGLLIQATRTLF